MSLVNNILKRFNDTVVYWDSPTNDGSGGFTYDEPEELSCRWVQGSEVMRGDNGEETASDATVYVSKALDQQGMLFLGTLDDSNFDSNLLPDQVTAYRILKTERIPSLQKASESIYKVYLGWQTRG